MNRDVLAAVVSSGSLLLLSCASTQEEAKNPTADPPTTVAQAQDSGADLSPVEAPSELLVVGRLARPAWAVDTMLKWLGTPLDWRAGLNVHAPEVAQALDLDAPLHLAVMLAPAGSERSPTTAFVASVGLRSLDVLLERQRARGFAPTQLGPGIYRIGAEADGSCAAAVAVGEAPARLVCGDEAGLELLLPFATRGLPTMDLGSSDLDLHLLAQPLRDQHRAALESAKRILLPMLLEQQGLDSGEIGAPLTEALAAAASEGFAALESIERLSASLDFDEDDDFATLTLTCEFAPSNSVFSRSLTVAAEAVSPPPDQFWRLPVEATGVTWVNWPRTPMHEALRTHAGPALEGLLKHRGAKPASLKAASRAARLLADSTPLVGAGRRGGSGPGTSTQSPTWQAYNVTREKAQVEAEIDAWMTLLKDPAVRELDEDWVFASRKRAHRVQGLGAPTTRYDLKVTPSVAELLTRIPQPSATGVGAQVPVVLMVHPSAEGTWLVFAGDGKSAEAQLRRVTSGDGRTLAQEEGLAVLRHRNANGGGAMSIAGILGELQAEGIVPDPLPEAVLADLTTGRVWLPYTYAAGQRADRIALTGSVILPSAVFKAAGGVALPSILELMKP